MAAISTEIWSNGSNRGKTLDPFTVTSFSKITKSGQELLLELVEQMSTGFNQRNGTKAPLLSQRWLGRTTATINMRASKASSTTRQLGCALLACALSFGVLANAQGSAEALVKGTTERVLEILNKDREVISNNPTRIYGIVNKFIVPYFDIERMSQRVLGKFWHRATEEQQRKFVREFQTLLVHTYGAALREYSTQKVEYLPSRSRDGGEISVRTQIVQTASLPIPIYYEMYKLDVGWKIYDVTIDGVSLVINYRSTFASEIRNSGVDGLIERLMKHNQGRR